jgi:redox-sensitive bicupin YhaK (pirin superfamily)
MDRKVFIKNTLLGITAAATGSVVLNASGLPENSTYTKLSKQVGFNHLPNKEKKTMKTVFHEANSRGYANHGWLKTNHTFSFANYYNPERIHFGALRVLNDDNIDGGMGFGTHPHDNMEIITIPLKGDLAHKDSMGNGTTIKSGDIQVMSAGTGIKHSEFNANEDKAVELLQIWVFPNKKQVKPRYDQITLDDAKMKNNLHQILSPDSTDEGVWIHQNAWFHLGNFEEGKKFEYELRDKSNGVYLFLIGGKMLADNQEMNARDGFGLWETEKINFEVLENAEILIMEVPMNI